jgi:hypothetical protein
MNEKEIILKIKKQQDITIIITFISLVILVVIYFK